MSNPAAACRFKDHSMGFRLFVSHSTPKPKLPRLVAIVEAIKGAAGEDQVEVIFDKEQIQLGDDWRNRIAFMLHACHAAILLLDENSRNSDWVLTEAIFLSLRNQVDPQFQFIPVSLLLPEESTAESLDARAARAKERVRFGEGTWRVVDLGRLQQARGATPRELGDLVVKALRNKGNLVPHSSPVDRLALQLAVNLGGVPDALLDLVIDDVNWDGVYLQPDRSTQAAMAITAKLIGDGRLSEIRDALDALGSAITNNRMLAILDGVAPLPLDPRAAALLTRKRAGSAGRMHASIQTGYANLTVPWYIARAYLADRPKVMPINNADASFDSLQADLREAWRLQNRRRGEISDADVDEQLRSTPRYVTLPGPLDPEVLGRLDATYPAISFVIYSTHEIGWPLPPNVVELVPRLAPEREKEIINDYLAATDSLG
jgi:hypothetical protein